MTTTTTIINDLVGGESLKTRHFSFRFPARLGIKWEARRFSDVSTSP